VKDFYSAAYEVGIRTEEDGAEVLQRLENKKFISITVQNEFLYTFGSEGYDAISGAKATGNLKEVEDEAEASIADTSKLI